jgi:hypothetical protein
MTSSLDQDSPAQSPVCSRLGFSVSTVEAAPRDGNGKLRCTLASPPPMISDHPVTLSPRLFSIEGLLAIGVAFLFILLLPRSPSRPTPLFSRKLQYFTERERHILSTRVVLDDTQKANTARAMTLHDITSTLADPCHTSSHRTDFGPRRLSCYSKARSTPSSNHLRHAPRRQRRDDPRGLAKRQEGGSDPSQFGFPRVSRELNGDTVTSMTPCPCSDVAMRGCPPVQPFAQRV